MSKEVMQQALEALDIVNPKEFAQADPDGKIDKAITALREALAKPDFWEGYVPEPVKPAPMTKDEFMEPLGCVVVRPLVANSTTPKPAQRTWVELTNNELQPIADEYRILFGSWVEDFARAIEAKLRSKNEDRN